MIVLMKGYIVVVAILLLSSFRLSDGLLQSKSSIYQKKTSNVIPNSKQSLIVLDAVESLSLIGTDDRWALWAIASSAAALGLKLERTAIGKSLSGPVCSMLITAILTNVGVLPSGSIHMTNLQSFVVKLATPLLLLGADLNKIFRDTGSLMKAFLLGTIGTLLGSSLGFLLFGPNLSTLGELGDNWKIAACLTAKNIGGGLNFMSVADALKPSPLSIGTGLAVDNLLGLLYFPLISWIGGDSKDSTSTIVESNQIRDEKSSSSENEIENLTTALAIGMAIAATAEFIATRTSLPPVPISTFIAVILATSIPSRLKEVIPSGDNLGRLLLMLFFGSIGTSSGTIATTFTSSGAVGLCGFGLVLYAVHLAVILGFGKLLKFPLSEILIASNANIGNAATAAALASAKGWKSKLLPAFLVGTFGNAIGTFCGLILGQTFLRKLAENMI